MKSFKMTVAGCKVLVNYRYDRCLDYCKDYLTSEEFVPDVVASVSREELEQTLQSVEGLSPEMAEITALYRPIAQKMPSLGGFVIHGASISYRDKGYLFTAPSGTGKSTHIRLWKKHLGAQVDIVNGDKPIITAREEILIHGTPWAGKERWQKNRCVPLAGICLVTRGEKNTVRRASAEEFLPFLFRQTFLSPDAEITLATMELLDKVLTQVPVYLLSCNISEEAVKCSFEAMTGESYPPQTKE